MQTRSRLQSRFHSHFDPTLSDGQHAPAWKWWSHHTHNDPKESEEVSARLQMRLPARPHALRSDPSSSKACAPLMASHARLGARARMFSRVCASANGRNCTLAWNCAAGRGSARR
eukprot:5524231-Pleurochrysis_carterae.AAC.1